MSSASAEFSQEIPEKIFEQIKGRSERSSLRIFIYYLILSSVDCTYLSKIGFEVLHVKFPLDRTCLS